MESKFKKATKAQKGRPTSAQRHSGKAGAVASESDACPVPECVALVENGQYVGPIDGYRPSWDHISRCHDQGGSKGNLPKRLVVEYCCSPTSRLGECDALKKPWTSNCVVLRLTEELDMTTSKGLRLAEQSLRSWQNGNILLWAAIPCTGGSTWQRVNEHLYMGWPPIGECSHSAMSAGTVRLTSNPCRLSCPTPQ